MLKFIIHFTVIHTCKTISRNYSWTQSGDKNSVWRNQPKSKIMTLKQYILLTQQQRSIPDWESMNLLPFMLWLLLRVDTFLQNVNWEWIIMPKFYFYTEVCYSKIWTQMVLMIWLLEHLVIVSPIVTKMVKCLKN